MSHQVSSHDQVEARWTKIRGQLKERWSQLTDEDLELIDGDSRKLISLVHQKTGDNLNEIEQAIDEIAGTSDGLMSRVIASTQQAAQSVADRVSGATADGYEAVGNVVKQSPATSVATAFASGFAIGLCAVVLFSGSPRSTRQKLDAKISRLMNW